DRVIGLQRRGEDESDLVLHEHIAGPVARAGFGSAVGDELETEGGAVEVRRLARVAYVELEGIGAVEREKILLNGAGMLQRLRHNSFSMLRYRGGCLRRSRSRRGCRMAGRTS